jgi:hypothetical protein
VLAGNWEARHSEPLASSGVVFRRSQRLWQGNEIDRFRLSAQCSWIEEPTAGRIAARVAPREVSVFDAAAQHYEYINCHPNTGLMRAA